MKADCPRGTTTPEELQANVPALKPDSFRKKVQSPPTVFPSDKPRNSKRGFVRIDNSAMQDARLSFRARGVLAFVLSKPKDFRHSAEGLAKQSAEGPHAMEGAIKELIDAGRCKRIKNRDSKGHIRSVLHFYETPQPTAENRGSVPTATLPTVGEPTGRSTDSRLSAGLLNDGLTNESLRNESRTNESEGKTLTPPSVFIISASEQDQ